MKKLLLLVFLSITAHASEEQSYCDMTTEKSEADRILFVSPNAQLTLGRNPTTLSNVVMVGVTESLSHYLKGQLQRDVGQGDCQLYRSMADLAKHATYDGIVIRNSVVARKADAIEDAVKQIDDLYQNESKRVAAGNSTVPTLELLETAKAKLDSDLFEMQSQNNPMAVPTLSNHPVDELIANTSSLLANEQHLLAKSAKYDNWDVALGVGGAVEFVGGNKTSSPYATLTFAYQIGSSKRSEALDRAADAATKLLTEQGTGPVQLAYLLRTKVQEMIKFNSSALQAAMKYDEAIANNLKLIDGLDTSDAHKFRIQLTLDQINNQVQIRTLQQSNSILTKYLAINYSHQ
jgi:hypothetical protein